MSVVDLIQKDKRLRTLLRMVKKNSFALDSRAYIKEIEQLHINRRARNLTVKDVLQHFQSKAIDAVLQTQANRSRITEIKMRAFKVHARLDKHTTLVRQHLRSTYSVQLARSFSTAADRDNAINSLLELPMRTQKDIKIVMDIADLAITDLDQASWSNKALISIMELGSERKTAKI